MSGPLRTFSHGGGVQSTAALVLSADGRIDFPVHLFANVGDDSEAPETLDYVRQVSMPYAAKHGIEFHELRRERRDGEMRTLLQELTRAESRSVKIPVRMANGAPGTRSCTQDFKIDVIARWHREHGATPDNPARVGIGFSVDEIERASLQRHRRYEIAEFPLLALGLRRSDCLRIIADAGLPPAPKSACWFCPYHRPSTWAEMRRDQPDQFQAAVDLEALLNRRRDSLGKDHVFLTRFGRPLDEGIGIAQDQLFPDAEGWGETCDEGVCFI